MNEIANEKQPIGNKIRNRKDGLDPRKIKPGKYRHYKGADYQVINTVYHSETQELLVLYRPLYGQSALWVRPYDMFNELINVEGKMLRRFQAIEE